MSDDSNQKQWDSSNVFFKCAEPTFQSSHHTCLCKKYRVYHSYYFEEQVSTEVESILGIYDKSENNFGISLFKQQSKELYLFSVHPKGRVWSIGNGLTITDAEAAHIEFQSYNENLCPHYVNLERKFRFYKGAFLHRPSV